MSECQICAESYTAVTRARITCVKCDFVCCKQCFKRYATDPDHYLKCMSCGVEFDRPALRARLGPGFMSVDFRDIREAVLYEHEKSLFPMTQLLVERELEKKSLIKQRSSLDDKYDAVKRELRAKQIEFRHTTDEMPVIKAIDIYLGFEAQIRELDVQLQEERTQLDIAIETINTKAAVKRTYILSCPHANCKGMLSAEKINERGNFICAVCDMVTCKACHSVSKDDTYHECDPDILKTLAFVEKTTKPCPACGVPIHKTEGCFAANTPVLMWDQSIKMSQDIKIGDVLIGDDGTPRTVLATCSGEDQMFEIQQANGISYTVNSKHTLVLKKSYHDDIVEMRVDDFMKLSEKKKGQLLGFKSSISMNYPPQNLSTDPYMLGMPRKECKNFAPNKDYRKPQITVVPIGTGRYYGWELDGNHRFVAPDMTVLRNCDQMFCTACHTSWSWRTGRVNSGAIHNPYHAQWLRENRGRQREIGDVQCGRELSVENALLIEDSIKSVIRSQPNPLSVKREMKPDMDYLFSVQRIGVHHTHVTIPALARTRPTHETNQNLRMLLLMGNITEVSFKKEIQRVDKMASRRNAYLHVVQMYRDSLIDIIWPFIVDQRKPLDEWKAMICELRALEAYANECLRNISATYCSSSTYTILGNRSIR